MGPVTAQLVEELGYDPDDGVPDVGTVTAQDLRGGVRVGEMIAARDGARRVAVARLTSGKLVIVDDECPHDGGRISDGFVDGERLVCARHGWELEAPAHAPGGAGRCERACKLRE